MWRGKDGATYNHSVLVNLTGCNGQLVSTISYQEKEEDQLAKLRRLLASQ
jgi:hypothetical protein